MKCWRNILERIVSVRTMALDFRGGQIESKDGRSLGEVDS